MNIASRLRRNSRARWTRDFTAASVIPAALATSAIGKPSTSQDDHGAILDRELSDRRGQRGPEFRLYGRVMDARRPVADRTGVPPILVEWRENLVQRDLVTSARAAT